MQSFLAFEMFLFLLLACFLAWALSLSTPLMACPSVGAQLPRLLEAGREWCVRYLAWQLDRIGSIWSPCARQVVAEAHPTVLPDQLCCAQLGGAQADFGLIRPQESARQFGWKSWLSDPGRTQHAKLVADGRAQAMTQWVARNS